MRTFDAQAGINELLDQVGLTETMEELAPPTCKVCGDPYSAHQHYRSGTDRAQCPCPQYRATTRTQYVI
jgi:hypothetical protein